MNFLDTIKQALKVVELNDASIKKVAGDQSLTWEAVFIIVLSSFCGAFGSYVFPLKNGLVTYKPTIIEAFGHLLVAVFLFLGVVYLLHLMANYLFKAHGDYFSLLRVTGHGYVIGVLNVLPVLSILVFVWMLVLLVRILKDVKRLTVEQSIICMVVTGIVVFVCLALFQDLNADNLYGGLYLVPY